LDRLYESAGDYPIAENHCKPEEASIPNYYRSLLETAKRLPTPYLALAEDDTLYSEEHFNYRPEVDTFAYNFSRWNVATWSQPPFFSLGQRAILGAMIAPRELFIDWLEERFKVDPDGEKLQWWGEPGRKAHEKGLKVSGRKSEIFNTYNPIVVFQHADSYSYDFSGKKRAGKIRALEIPHFGRADEVVKLYQ
jgi:hypothetical protein